jgi:hypothetical protein
MEIPVNEEITPFSVYDEDTEEDENTIESDIDMTNDQKGYVFPNIVLSVHLSIHNHQNTNRPTFFSSFDITNKPLRESFYGGTLINMFSDLRDTVVNSIPESGCMKMVLSDSTGRYTTLPIIEYKLADDERDCAELLEELDKNNDASLRYFSNHSHCLMNTEEITLNNNNNEDTNNHQTIRKRKKEEDDDNQTIYNEIKKANNPGQNEKAIRSNIMKGYKLVSDNMKIYGVEAVINCMGRYYDDDKGDNIYIIKAVSLCIKIDINNVLYNLYNST